MSWLLLSVGQGAPFVAAAMVTVGWLGLLPALAWRKARRRRYRVTDSHLLAITSDRPDGEWQLQLGRIERIERRDHDNGTATLVLLPAGLSPNRLVLHGIDRPDAAVAALSSGDQSIDHISVWPVTTGWRSDPASALPSALEPDERMVWSGRPEVLASVREIAIEAAPLAALALPITALLFWILPIGRLLDGDGKIQQLSGLVFGLVGFAIVAPMLFAAIVLPVAAVWRASTSVIAVTDRRILIAQGWRRITVRSLFADDLRRVATRHTRGDGRASLHLKLRRQSALPGIDPVFHAVADAAIGEAAIDALLATIP